MTGAMAGATPTTNIIRASALPTRTPSNRSRMIAVDSTMPAAAVKPWTNRSPVSMPTEPANTMPSEATTYTLSATSSGSRRPSASDTDPITN